MSQTLQAIYRNGRFVLKSPCDLPEEAEVELLVQGPLVLPPTVTDSAKRSRILEQITRRLRENPVPDESPRFSREELHERR